MPSEYQAHRATRPVGQSPHCCSLARQVKKNDLMLQGPDYDRKQKPPKRRPRDENYAYSYAFIGSGLKRGARFHVVAGFHPWLGNGSGYVDHGRTFLDELEIEFARHRGLATD
jgi:hypothetical protein